MYSYERLLIASYQAEPLSASQCQLQRCSLSLAGAATSIIFVATKVLSQQIFVATNTVCLDKHTFSFPLFCCCCDETFVRTSILLSRQTRVCRDKTFVATKMILEAAPANDISQRPSKPTAL